MGVRMNTKNIVVSATLVACASLATVTTSAQEPLRAFAFTYDGFGAGFRVPVEAKVVKGAPFSAEIVNESVQTLADGNRIVQRSTTRIYRDSEGRVRREEDRPSGSPAISITDPVSRVSFSLDAESRIAWQTPNMATFHLTEAAHALQRRAEFARAEVIKGLPPGAGKNLKNTIAIAPFDARLEGEKVTVEQLPARVIEGVRAEGTRRTTTIAAGAIGNELPIETVSEEWTSPDLNILVMTERRDPRLGTSTYRLANIIRAEPDRWLFEVPSDYTLQGTGVHWKSGRGAAPRK
jgi:hypothetical protein